MRNRKNHTGLFIFFALLLGGAISVVYATAIVLGQTMESAPSYATSTLSSTANITCGSAQDKVFTAAPTAELCTNNGHASAVTLNGEKWVWSCLAYSSTANGGVPVNCSAQYLQVKNGACGSMGGAVLESAPTDKFCAENNAPVDFKTTEGGWGWICEGKNGGKAVACVAQKAQTQDVTYVMPGLLQNIASTVKGSIITPHNDAVIENGQLAIEVKAENASKIELYLKKNGASQEMYLGSAKKTETADTWKLTKETQGIFADGEYILLAKISNASETVNGKAVYLKLVTNAKQTVTGSDTDLVLQARTEIEQKQVAAMKEGKEKENFENPKDNGQVDQKYVVNSVEMIAEKPLQTDQEGGAKKLRFSGKATPDALVTLYVYSNNPVVVVVKADANGNWVYDLDKDLADGNHEAYVALMDETGKISAKSEPLYFVKTAEAATVINGAQADERKQLLQNGSPVENSKRDFLSVAIAIAVIFVSVALALIGMITYKNRE